jgi:hypothetical protein
MENQQGCCHDEYKIVKISDDQLAVKANQAFLSGPVTDVIPFNVSISLPFQGQVLWLSGTYHSPPDPRSSSIYQYDRVFRI